jgi:V/A-type H+-transporting ATPase subunit C
VSDSVRYGYAVGRVRVLQTRIFGAGTYERLVDAPDFAEQRKILSDSAYGRYLEGAESADDVEAALQSAMESFYGFLDVAGLPEPVVRFFRVRHDYANVRAVLKARALGAPLEEMLVPFGTVTPEVVAGSTEALPVFLRSVAEAVALATASAVEGEREVRGEDATPGALGDMTSTVALIDGIVEVALFADLRHTARAAKSPFLRGLATLLIDVANAKTVLRSRRRGLPPAALNGVLQAGGSFDEKWLKELYAAPIETLAAALAAVPGLRGVITEDLLDPAALDVSTDNLIVKYVKQARVAPTGPDPVIAYVFAREAEVVAVRMLLIGKLAGLDEAALRRRLRDRYV